LGPIYLGSFLQGYEKTLEGRLKKIQEGDEKKERLTLDELDTLDEAREAIKNGQLRVNDSCMNVYRKAVASGRDLTKMMIDVLEELSANIEDDERAYELTGKSKAMLRKDLENIEANLDRASVAEQWLSREYARQMEGQGKTVDNIIP